LIDEIEIPTRLGEKGRAKNYPKTQLDFYFILPEATG
jgi:hypothetical protein